MDKTKIFISKSNKIHNDKYDYSETVYLHSEKKLIINCFEHGKFEQKPCHHLRGSGCKKCGIIKNSKNKTKSNKNFIIEAKKIHGEKYDYSLVDYKHSNSKIIIICTEHGKFEQIASNHIRGCGCNKCGIIVQTEKITKTNEQYISECKKIHGDKYDYSLVDYKHSEEEIIIICKIHGKFEQKPCHHLRGSGCNKCGIITQTEKITKTNEQYISECKKIHDIKYDYSLVDYKHSKLNIIINCLKHGNFEQLPQNHLNGQGCPQCSFEKTISKSEQEIVDYLKSLYINNIITSDRSILSGKEIDIYLPDYKLAIEFNGLYWHSENKKENKNYHLEKTNQCNNLDIQLIHIFEDEWLNKQEIVKSRLCNLLNKNTNKIYGRETIVKVIDNKQYRTFIDNNHLQGYVAGKIYLGLFYTSKETNKEYLVSVMSFGSLRKNLGNTPKNNYYELLRFANSKYLNVIGGASKLLKYFEKHYKPEYIISYADKRWSKGNLYQQLKFELIRESIPNYFYVKGLKRENRFSYRKDILISKYGCLPEMTEKQFMNEVMKMNRIYDCGNCVFEKHMKKIIL